VRKASNKTVFVFCVWLSSIVGGWATSNYEYGPDEYDTIVNGVSPDGKYAIATHGSGDNYRYPGFNADLMNNVTGKRIGPLEEIADNLDTGSNAFAAKWSADSISVYVVYRISRHEPLQAVTYRIAKGRAYPQTQTHIDATPNKSSTGSSTIRDIPQLQNLRYSQTERDRRKPLKAPVVSKF
jgi:hypothetical protein